MMETLEGKNTSWPLVVRLHLRLWHCPKRVPAESGSLLLASWSFAILSYRLLPADWRLGYPALSSLGLVVSLLEVDLLAVIT